MRLFHDTVRAIVTSLKERADELTAIQLLEKTLSVINSYAEPHWRGGLIYELPEMIHELARDRDDFKKMSIAYREDLAKTERRIRELELNLKILNEGTTYHKHEAWCNVFGRCNCAELDEEDV